VRFWDTAGVVPLIIAESSTDATIRALADDPRMVVWWGTPVEAMSAVARREREGHLAAAGVKEAIDRLQGYQATWTEIQPSETIRRTSVRLLRVHPLRAVDAFQLAAAIVASGERPGELPFVTLDTRLADAASREGFPVIRPGLG
jgi:predicted nucleic acid-binding protein